MNIHFGLIKLRSEMHSLRVIGTCFEQNVRHLGLRHFNPTL